MIDSIINFHEWLNHHGHVSDSSTRVTSELLVSVFFSSVDCRRYRDKRESRDVCRGGRGQQS